MCICALCGEYVANPVFYPDGSGREPYHAACLGRFQTGEREAWDEDVWEEDEDARVDGPIEL